MKYAYKNLKGKMVMCSKPKAITEHGILVLNENGVTVLVKRNNLFKKVKHK